MWAHQHYGIEPDMIAFGKKTQVCGFLCGRRIEDIEDHVFAVSSRLNSTWGGNLIDMVRFKLYLDIIEEEKLVEHAAQMGERAARRPRTICRPSSRSTCRTRAARA